MWVIVWPPCGVGDTLFWVGRVVCGDGNNVPSQMLAKLSCVVILYIAIFHITRYLLRHNTNQTEVSQAHTNINFQ